jgi:NTE family protein
VLFPKRHKPKLGLVLNGGGARGPYQLGVYLAMEKFGLDKMIVGTSGASVGSFMSVLFLYQDPEKILKTWSMINNPVIKKDKGNKVAALANTVFKKQGFYSRDGLTNLVNSTMDLHAMCRDSAYPLFVSLAEKQADDTYKPRYIKLNGLPSKDILTILLATSAIPYVFDPVEYEGKIYVDPMKADNEPYKPLLDLNMDMLFILPVNDSHLNKSYPKDFKYDIVDFASPRMMVLPKLNMIDFSQENTDMYVSEGYQVGKLLLHYLYSQKLLHAMTKPKRNSKEKAYYSLHTLNIDNIEFATMSFKDILEDVKKGAE